MTLLSHDGMIDASVDGIGMLDALIRNMEAEVQTLRRHREHLLSLGKHNGVPVERMAEACGVNVQAIYQSINNARSRDGVPS